MRLLVMFDMFVVLQIGKMNFEARQHLPSLTDVAGALDLAEIRRAQILAANLDQILNRQLVSAQIGEDLLDVVIVFFGLCEIHLHSLSVVTPSGICARRRFRFLLCCYSAASSAVKTSPRAAVGLTVTGFGVLNVASV